MLSVQSTKSEKNFCSVTKKMRPAVQDGNHSKSIRAKFANALNFKRKQNTLNFKTKQNSLNVKETLLTLKEYSGLHALKTRKIF
jgi:hypothetical protein